MTSKVQLNLSVVQAKALAEVLNDGLIVTESGQSGIARTVRIILQRKIYNADVRSDPARAASEIKVAADAVMHD
jgi:hypothetical protein